MQKQFFALVFVAIILMAGVGAVKNGYRTSVKESQLTPTFDESFTVDEGNVTSFAESNRDVVYNKTIRLEQGGTVYEADGNYTWYENNGTLLVKSGSALTDGNSANITYSLSEPTNEHKAARSIGQIPTTILGGTIVHLLGLFALIGAVVVLMRMGGY